MRRGAPLALLSAAAAAAGAAGGNESGHCAAVDGGACEWVDLCASPADFHAELHDGPPYNIMALAGCVTCGALLRWAAKAQLPGLCRLPYTVVVFLIGMLFGCVARPGDAHSNVLQRYDDLVSIDPHLIFYIFLPVLIFESAFAIDTHVFRRVAAHCMLLAGPGILAASALTGAVVKHAFAEYEWSWVAALLFGTMCSATDPVAVVALLKELGAGAEISTLIEGESLLNDGTAIVVFEVLRGSVPSGEMQKGAAEVLVEFVRVAGGGPVVGLVAAWASEKVIGRVFNDALVEVSLTCAMAYVTFFVAEGMLHVSGVLALVVMGMYLSAHVQCVSHEVEHMLHGFWEILVYIANTVIFGLAGLIVAEKVFAHTQPIDFAYLLLLYGTISVVRFVVIAALMPALQRVRKYPLDLANACLLCHGGLRGAVGLALALIVENDAEIRCALPNLGPKMMFHVSGIVFLTLLVNGVSTGALVRSLGLDGVSAERRRAMRAAVRKVRAAEAGKLRMLSAHPVAAVAHWGEVRAATLAGLRDPFSTGPLGDDDADVDEDESRAGLDESVDAWEEGRRFYFKYLLAKVWEQSNHGTLSAQGCRWLVKLVKTARDGDRQKLLAADDVQHLFGLTKGDRMKVAAVPCFRLEARLLRDRWMFAFEVLIAFMRAHDHALEAVESAGHIRQVAAHRILEHCKRTRMECLQMLTDEQRRSPAVARAIETRHAARRILDRGHSVAHDLIRSGQLGAADGQLLVDMIERQMEEVLRQAARDVGAPSAADVLAHVKWAREHPALAAELRRVGRVRSCRKGDAVIPPGRREVAVIITGVCRMCIRGRALYHGPGYAAGLLAALSGEDDVLSHLCAETDVDALYVDADVLLRAAVAAAAAAPRSGAARGPVDALWLAAGSDAACTVLSARAPYSTWAHERVESLCADAELYAAPRSGYFRARGLHWLPRGSMHFLLNGHCQRWETPAPRHGAAARAATGARAGGDSDPEQHRIQAVSLLPEAFDAVTLSPDAVVLSVRDPASARGGTARRWAVVAQRVNLIRTVLRMLCAPASLRHARPALLRRLVRGHFGAGESLDVLTGGFDTLPALAWRGGAVHGMRDALGGASASGWGWAGGASLRAAPAGRRPPPHTLPTPTRTATRSADWRDGGDPPAALPGGARRDDPTRGAAVRRGLAGHGVIRDGGAYDRYGSPQKQWQKGAAPRSRSAQDALPPAAGRGTGGAPRALRSPANGPPPFPPLAPPPAAPPRPRGGALTASDSSGGSQQSASPPRPRADGASAPAAQNGSHSRPLPEEVPRRGGSSAQTAPTPRDGAHRQSW